MSKGPAPIDATATAKASGPANNAAPRPAMRRVFVSDYELIGSVGVYEHERRYEQRIVVSLDLDVEDTYDGRSDELDGVYDYDHAISAVRSTVESRHFNLLETMAERIAEACLLAPSVIAIRVRITKPDVLIACRAVGIEIARSR
jgi:7,8-dihydroneopterin aldolase/epimerase/oxygenase